MVTPEVIASLTKYQYSITQIAEIFEVNTSLLRFWEKEFKQLKPHKNNKGSRFYRKNDIDVIFQIYQLVKVKGYTLQGARDALKNGIPNDDRRNHEIKKELQEIRSKLVEMYIEL